MEDITAIKSLIASLDQETQEHIIKHLDSLDKILTRNQFLIQRNNRDSKVNANFIKKTVEQLELSNKQLKVSNEDLQRLNLKLENSNEELERFAYIASHDLKTPLNNIYSFSLLLEKELKDHPNPRISEFLHYIKSGSERMNTLIKSVLEFSKLERIQEEKEEVNLNDILDEVKSNISSYIDERNASIILENKLPTIHFYRSEMLKLFQNLIENGIKYNNSETPTVSILSEESGGYVCLGFKDNGIGIDPMHHNTITKMFARLHNQSEYEGSGLGLSICKKIIKRMKGKLIIESEGKEGSLFMIKFKSN